MSPSADASFEQLDVWRRAHALSIALYRMLDDCGDAGFRDQITRSANRISDQIAEGAERTSQADLRRYLDLAKGAAGETRSQVIRAAILGYLDAEPAERLRNELQEIGQMLQVLIQSLES